MYIILYIIIFNVIKLHNRFFYTNLLNSLKLFNINRLFYNFKTNRILIVKNTKKLCDIIFYNRNVWSEYTKADTFAILKPVIQIKMMCCMKEFCILVRYKQIRR